VKFVAEDLLPSKMTCSEALKVVWLGDYFKISELVFIMIDTFVIAQIDNDNVIQFINESYAKLKSIGKPGLSRQNSVLSMNDKSTIGSIIVNQEKEEDAWFSLLDKSLEYMTKSNPIQILKNQKTQQQIPKVIIDEIAERTHKRSE
jgi:hypothetical protein